MRGPTDKWTGQSQALTDEMNLYALAAAQQFCRIRREEAPATSNMTSIFWLPIWMPISMKQDLEPRYARNSELLRHYPKQHSTPIVLLRILTLFQYWVIGLHHLSCTLARTAL